MVSLSGTNYQAWKGKMEDLLYIKEYRKPVFAEAKPDDKFDDEWRVLHHQACGLIRYKETHACTLWQKLEELYARKEGTNKMFLIKQLINLSYLLWESHFEDEVRALLLLGSLPDTWETLKVTLCNSAPNGVVTWNLVNQGAK
ncbi:hypothetical protein BS78_06G063600 [Paspalum vaginatum]|nr:hypothetical protein BS78_06G063600 [Paspalum vaginatum]